jgi:hypothetical protein
VNGLCGPEQRNGTGLTPGKVQGLGISVTVDCILSECVVTDVQLGNNPCERRFSVLTFLRAVGFSSVCQEASKDLSGCALTGLTGFLSRAAVYCAQH